VEHLMRELVKLLFYALTLAAAGILGCCDHAQAASTARSYSRSPLIVGREGATAQLTLTTSTLASTGNLGLGVPTTATLTLTQGGTAELTLTAGQVAIRNTFLVDTTTFAVDAANNRVGVGTASPGYTVDISGDLRVNSTTAQGIYMTRATGPASAKVMYVNGAASGNTLTEATIISSVGGRAIQLLPNSAAVPGLTVSSDPRVTVNANDGLSRFNVEGGATIGSSSYVGNATYTAANGEVFLERNLMIGDVTTSGTALINMGVNRTGALPLIAMANNGSGDAVVLVTNAGNVWQWGSRNSATGDPFVIAGGTSPTVTDLIYITKGGQMGIDVAVPDAILDVSASAARDQVVLELDQKSDTNNFISFLGNDDITAPGADPVSSSYLPAAIGDFDIAVRVEVNGVAYWLPLYQ
jgi:hypothetical protein